MLLTISVAMATLLGALITGRARSRFMSPEMILVQNPRAILVRLFLGAFTWPTFTMDITHTATGMNYSKVVHRKARFGAPAEAAAPVQS